MTTLGDSMGNNSAAAIELRIKNAAVIRSREAGLQDRLNFELPGQFIGLQVIAIFGGEVQVSKGNTSLVAINPELIKMLNVGQGIEEYSRVRVIIPDEYRGSCVYIAVV